jgi:hypothetical protein
VRDESVVREDPWLLAAEVAVASVAGRRPMFVRQGRKVLESGRLPALQTAKLASAIATLEMTAGDTRSARRLFRESLVDPTDNSLAQAGWGQAQCQALKCRRAIEPSALIRSLCNDRLQRGSLVVGDSTM